MSSAFPSVVNCSNSMPSLGVKDCNYWVTDATYGCDASFPDYYMLSGKIKNYCKLSCNSCGGSNLEIIFHPIEIYNIFHTKYFKY